MSDRYEESLRVLGLEPGASEQAIKDAYRDLVKVWHPDRFGSDARLLAKAQEKLKDVNAAFEQLRGYRASDLRRPYASARPAEPPSDASAAPVPASRVERSTAGRRSTVPVFLAVTALTAIVGTALFVWRAHAPQQLSPADEPIQAPEPVSSVPESAPPHPIKKAPQGPHPSAGDAGRGSTAPATTGSLIVTSRPMGARVSFDGRLVGETPIVVTGVIPGEHHIELTLDGKAYQAWSSSVVVTAGQEEKLLAVLTPTVPGR